MPTAQEIMNLVGRSPHAARIGFSHADPQGRVHDSGIPMLNQHRQDNFNQARTNPRNIFQTSDGRQLAMLADAVGNNAAFGTFDHTWMTPARRQEFDSAIQVYSSPGGGINWNPLVVASADGSAVNPAIGVNPMNLPGAVQPPPAAPAAPAAGRGGRGRGRGAAAAGRGRGGRGAAAPAAPAADSPGTRRRRAGDAAAARAAGPAAGPAAGRGRGGRGSRRDGGRGGRGRKQQT
jgi:hypothetical protein